jgi:hypothetical protein
VIAVVLGSKDRLVRNKEAAELMAKCFAALPPLPPPVVMTNAVPTNTAMMPEPAGEIEIEGDSSHRWVGVGLGVLGGLLLSGVVAWLARRGNR